MLGDELFPVGIGFQHLEALVQLVEQVRVFLAHGGTKGLDLAENADDLNRSLGLDRKSTRLNSSHSQQSRMPSSA